MGSTLITIPSRKTAIQLDLLHSLYIIRSFLHGFFIGCERMY